MYHLFISYAEDDADYAYKIKKNLRTLGFPVWMEGDGDRVSGLISSIVVVVIMSVSARQSERVRHDINLAINRKLTIFPLRISGDAPLSELEHLQYHEVYDRGMPHMEFYDALWNELPYDPAHLEKAESDLTKRLVAALISLTKSGEVRVSDVDRNIHARVRPLKGDRVRAEFTFPRKMARANKRQSILDDVYIAKDLGWKLLRKGSYRDAPLLFVERHLRSSVEVEDLAFEIADIYRRVFRSSLTNLTVM